FSVLILSHKESLGVVEAVDFIHEGFGGNTEFAKQRLVISRGTEVFQRDRKAMTAGVLLPALFNTGLDRDPERSCRQHLVAVVLILGVEPFQTWGRYHARGNARSLKCLTGFHRQLNF